MDMEKGLFMFHCRITNEEGRVISEGTKIESVRDFPDAAEKSETGSVGRALGILGYGTQFAPEFDEGAERIVDAPQPVGRGTVSRPAQRPATRPAARAPKEATPEPEAKRPISEEGMEGYSPPTTATATNGSAVYECAECQRPLTKGQFDYSTVRFGRPLCPTHQTKGAQTNPVNTAAAPLPPGGNKDPFQEG